MVLDKLQQFYKTKRPTAGSRYGETDDPYAIIRSILNEINPDWAGDWGEMKWAPPWGQGDYAKYPKGPGAVATDAWFDRAVKILEDGDYSGKAIDEVAALIMDKGRRRNKKVNKSMDLTKDVKIKKISSDLARFLGAAAGWAMSDDVVRAGGGTPRGQGASNAEWERALRQEEMREEQRRRKRERDEDRRHTAAERRRMRKSAAYPTFEKVNEFWAEKADEYPQYGLELIKEVFYAILKDHAPVPPRQGLVWDEVKHRWVRPENKGHSVSEVQGGKRIRGVGTGVHERSVGGHGAGAARLMESGRRFRGLTDTGTLKPHERKHPATSRIKRPRKTGKGKSKRPIGFTRVG